MSFAQVNPNVDHLDPLNWWPLYDMWSDRRAIPAEALLVLDDGLNAYSHPIVPEPSEVEGDLWKWLTGVDKHVHTHQVVLQFGSVGETLVSPDRYVYVSQKDYEQLLPLLPDAYAATFNALWAYHRAGHISRSDFDARAAKLREARDRINKQLENRRG